MDGDRVWVGGIERQKEHLVADKPHQHHGVHGNPKRKLSITLLSGTE
jgi:hypothetical protein